MNKIESIVYNLVRKNPALKQTVRNIYQTAFDMLPRQKEFFAGDYQYRDGFFFGFHDVSPFSQDETKLLANQVMFDLRMPKAGEEIPVGYFDLEGIQMGTFHQLGTSSAWNYHKGCRLQWLDRNRIIFNTSIGHRLVSKIVNIQNGENTIIDFPIDAVYVNENVELATNFSYERLERCMPGYGYPYQDDGMTGLTAPADSGLFLVDLKSNTRKLLVSIEELAQTVDKHFAKRYLHFVTHSEFSKDGRYISFLYRRIPIQDDYMKRLTRMMVYDLQKQELVTLPTQESGSHYVWNGKNQIIASCIINKKNCHVLYDMNRMEDYHVIGSEKLNSDGHQSFITDNVFITDTYPDRYRMAKIYKTDINSGHVELILSVYSPQKYQTKDFKCHIACDLHPRVSPSGKYVCFDSPRTGKRSIYIMKL